MTDDVTDTDRAIEHYRAELQAEAELARGDLAEIEDHLRSLIDELRAGGLPAGEAIAEAARRLGDPRQLAREHARVRTPFGARLSRARAWSAVALLAPLFYLQLCATVRYGWTAHAALELALSAGVLVALAARLPWARAMVLGVLFTIVGWDVMWLAGGGGGTHLGLELLASGGALAFTIPWGRHELSPGALALALLGPAYAAAATIMQLQITWADHTVVHPPWGPLALAGVLAAGAGAVVRGRWAVAPCMLAAGALVLATAQMWSLTVRLASPRCAACCPDQPPGIIRSRMTASSDAVTCAIVLPRSRAFVAR